MIIGTSTWGEGELQDDWEEKISEFVTDGYDFEDSTAVKDGAFVGLAIDEDNQDDLTEERIEKWVEMIKPSFQ